MILEKNNLQTVQEWTKSYIELIALYVHRINSNHLRSHQITLQNSTKQNETMLTNREWVSSRRITSILQLVTVIGQKSPVAWCTQKWLHYFKWSGETKQPNLKICRARVDKEGLSRMPTAWRSAKKLVHIMKLSQELGENVPSSYHGSKISGSQQSFLRKTVICNVER